MAWLTIIHMTEDNVAEDDVVVADEQHLELEIAGRIPVSDLELIAEHRLFAVLYGTSGGLTAVALEAGYLMGQVYLLFAHVGDQGDLRFLHAVLCFVSL